MSNYILKPGIKAEIKSDNDLNCAVGKILTVAPTSMPRILNSNDLRLTSKDILEAIRKHYKIKYNLSLKDKDLLEIQKDDKERVVSRETNIERVIQ